MARRRRFKLLNAALKTLMPVGGDADTIPPPPPSGSVLERFATRHSRDIDYPANPNRNRKLNDVGVVPFALDGDQDDVHIVPMSSRVSNLAGRMTPATAVNHQPITNQSTKNRLYTPAKVTIFVPQGTQASTKVTSKISGMRYNPREGTSYTIPYGRPVGGDGSLISREKGVRAAITAAVKVVSPNATISFKPEDSRYI